MNIYRSDQKRNKQLTKRNTNNLNDSYKMQRFGGGFRSVFTYHLSNTLGPGEVTIPNH